MVTSAREIVKQLKTRRLSSKVTISLSTSIKYKIAKTKIKKGLDHQNSKMKRIK